MANLRKGMPRLTVCLRNDTREVPSVSHLADSQQSRRYAALQVSLPPPTRIAHLVMTGTPPQSPPRIAITLGDIAGIGPEVVIRALDQAGSEFRPLIVGDMNILQRAAQLTGSPLQFVAVDHASCGPEDPNTIPCWNPTNLRLDDVPAGGDDARAGEAAYQWLIAATDAALRGEIDAIVTAPLSKAALHLAGRHYPGHTEILAERCGVAEFAMMLHMPHSETITGPWGISVAHVTLHTSIASVPGLLSQERIAETIQLVHQFVSRLGAASPRVGVCALNPHGGERGLFGDEESRLIAPAVEQCRQQGWNITGPLPADTLMQRAIGGEFDGVAAMYHDQGHIALKLIGFRRAVNITLGLPIVRTSPSHGTAFDIAWQGKANPDGMLQALEVATRLCQTSQR